jgi:hypothetical protein
MHASDGELQSGLGRTRCRRLFGGWRLAAFSSLASFSSFTGLQSHHHQDDSHNHISTRVCSSTTREETSIQLEIQSFVVVNAKRGFSINFHAKSVKVGSFDAEESLFSIIVIKTRRVSIIETRDKSNSRVSTLVLQRNVPWWCLLAGFGPKTFRVGCAPWRWELHPPRARREATL